MLASRDAALAAQTVEALAPTDAGAGPKLLELAAALRAQREQRTVPSFMVSYSHTASRRRSPSTR